MYIQYQIIYTVHSYVVMSVSDDSGSPTARAPPRLTQRGPQLRSCLLDDLAIGRHRWESESTYFGYVMGYVSKNMVLYIYFILFWILWYVYQYYGIWYSILGMLWDMFIKCYSTLIQYHGIVVWIYHGISISTIYGICISHIMICVSISWYIMV